LRRYFELVYQLFGGDKPIVLDQFHNQILSAPLCHSTSSTCGSFYMAVCLSKNTAKV
jgi:hypothetical protein